MIRARSAGFTLLEVLIALAILTVGLMVVMRVMGQAALVSNYQDQQITAANLARRKMVDLELEIEKKGFGTDETEECGTFLEDLADELDGPQPMLESFEYCWTLKKVELPLPMDMLGGKKDKDESGGSGISADRGQAQNPLAAGLPGGISPEAAGEQLGTAVRQLRLTIKWKTGNLPQELTVTTHLVNMTQAAVL